MDLALLSDSHDRIASLEWAAQSLRERGVQRILHLGDICSPECVDVLSGFDVEWVFGNCDWEHQRLSEAMKAAGHVCHGDWGELILESRRIAFTHGHHARRFASLLDGDYDLVCHGHSHERRDEVIGSTRVVNPGALQHARERTFAVLDLAADHLEWIVVDG